MTNYKTLLFFFLLTAVSTVLVAQQAAYREITFPVQQDNTVLPYPFAGGFNAPQFSAADLNNDGAMDLVAFDRSSNSLVTFLNNLSGGTGAYYYAPEYKRTFPPLTDYVLLRDFDGDGAMDIFTAPTQPGKLEMRVFKGYFYENVLHFAPFKFFYPNCATCDPTYIYYPDQIPGLYNNFPIAPSDMPGVEDVDSDGDLDIVAFPSGSSVYLYYLRNTSVENGFGSDSLHFVLEDRCWGKFLENGLIECKAKLSASPDVCAEPLVGDDTVEDRNGAHPGASITLFDFNNDTLKDVLLGNISFDCLNLVINGGTLTNAWMVDQDTLFPKNDVRVDLLSFPAAYHLDVDNDGVKDLLISPNSPTLHEDIQNVWWYKNANPSGEGDFKLQTRKLFTSGMIDHGTVSHPAFADVNADGLMDFVVGNYGFFQQAQNGNAITFTNARLYLYLNTGTNAQPKFNLADEDWLGMSQYAPNEYDFSPTFGDMDNDGDLDLLVGNTNGYLFYFNNEAGPNNPFNLVQDFNSLWASMDVGQVSAPAIFDLDQDGLADILVGERNGNVNYYKNIGSPTEPNFNPDENAAPNIPNLGKINTQIVPNGLGFSTPQVVEFQNNTLLITGSIDGQLEAYRLTGPTADSFPVVDLRLGNINPGQRSSPAFADINDDGVLELLAGNQRGGLLMYRTELSAFTPPVSVDTSTELEFQIRPNPTNSMASILMPSRYVQSEKNWAIFDALGRRLANGSSSQQQIQLPTEQYAQGIYWVRVDVGNAVAVRKLVVR
jgi:hypothetical protein